MDYPQAHSLSVPVCAPRVGSVSCVLCGLSATGTVSAYGLSTLSIRLRMPFMLGLGGPLGCRPLWTEPSLNSFNSRRVSDDVHLERFLSFTLEVSHAVPLPLQG